MDLEDIILMKISKEADNVHNTSESKNLREKYEQED